MYIPKGKKKNPVVLMGLGGLTGSVWPLALYSMLFLSFTVGVRMMILHD
jgi:hypothetical protein